jgi:triacylglycerol lipase
MRKAIPTITWQNIAPPYYEYEYFQACEQYPFHPTSEEFELVNAWWLSEAAALVYAEEEFVRPRFQRAGLPVVKYFNGESTDCFVASNETYIIVAFRGTESRRRSGAKDFRNILADVKADSNIMLVESEHGGKVHKGFNDALDEIWKDLFHYIKSLHCPSRSLWITGHSLGAALATLAAARYGDVQSLYTFGSPRVGDTGFKEHFAIRTYRVVNNTDIVTAVPPPGLYRHVGELWYIDSDGLIHHDIQRVEMWTDGIRSEMRNITNSIDLAWEGSFSFIPGGFKDHVPFLYAVHLWNNLVIQT